MKGNEIGIEGQGVTMLVMRKPVMAERELREVREGSTGRVVAMLPRVWAVAEAPAARLREVPSPAVAEAPVLAEAPVVGEPKVEMAFYRKYTEAMLRRYLRLSMEAGRVPSLLGRELFRGHVTSYKVKSFEDVVVFCLDVERCLKKLDAMERELVKRIALQEYTYGEAAAMTGQILRTCIRNYWRALDRLTELLLEAKLMEPLKSCQGGAKGPLLVKS